MNENIHFHLKNILKVFVLRSYLATYMDRNIENSFGKPKRH